MRPLSELRDSQGNIILIDKLGNPKFANVAIFDEQSSTWDGYSGWYSMDDLKQALELLDKPEKSLYDLLPYYTPSFKKQYEERMLREILGEDQPEQPFNPCLTADDRVLTNNGWKSVGEFVSLPIIDMPELIKDRLSITSNDLLRQIDDLLRQIDDLNAILNKILQKKPLTEVEEFHIIDATHEIEEKIKSLRCERMGYLILLNEPTEQEIKREATKDIIKDWFQKNFNK